MLHSLYKGKEEINTNSMISTVVDEEAIIKNLLGIDKIPCKIKSPFREDKHPSFALFRYKGSLFWKDFSTEEKGNVYSLIKKLKGDDYAKSIYFVKEKKKTITLTTNIGFSMRDWKDYDIEYWNSYGVDVEFLKKADVHPVNYKIIKKGKNEYYFKADKYAYAYVEHKDGKTQIKIYQPFNKDFKWCSSFDKNVWSLWTLLPKRGKRVIITSSLKDAANLWCNLGIPAVSLQGEGYLPKNTVVEELKARFDKVYVLYDSDEAGRKFSRRLCNKHYLYNIEIPEFLEAKDPSDLYKKYGKEIYMEVLKNLI